jgi:hypothetical protein
MNTNINNTVSLENSSIAQEANSNYDKIVDGVIQYLTNQNITDIAEQKSILTRACTKLAEQPVELLELELPQTISSLSLEKRTLLQRNTFNIINAFKKDTTYFIRLLESCVKYDILSENNKAIIQSKSTNQQKYSEFLSILPKRGNKVEAVIKELQKQNIIAAS